MMIPSEKTLYEYFSGFAKERGGDAFLTDGTRTLTVLQSLQTAENLAAQLQAAGVRRGLQVCVKAERTIENVLIFFALQLIGGIAVLYDPREEMPEGAKIADKTLYVGGEKTALRFEEGNAGFLPLSDSRETTVVIFTSGSTGERKAVGLSQYNFINNSLDTLRIGGYAPDDLNLLIVPIHHVFGVALIVTAVVARHGVFVPAKTDAESVLDCMEKFPVTRLNGVPSMYLSLAEKKGARKISSLRCGLIGGGPCTHAQFLKIEKELGVTLVPVYGMSECIGISCGDVSDASEKRCQSVGKVYSMNQVRIADDCEILVKSPAMACGAAEEDGWLHTGDLGYFDVEGYLHVDGRKKDIIIRNGNNYSAARIERKILRLPEIKEACVAGVFDEKEGEVPCALLVLRENVCLSAAEIENLLGTVLLKPEMPVKFEIASSVPLTSTGKPDKQQVKKILAAKMR